MERKFSFDDMEFVARSETIGGTLHVGIFDAYGERIHASQQPAARKSGRKPKGASAPPADESQAIAALIEDFKRKVEAREIDLA